jgi:DNA-binding response OmpR family regulator
MKKVLIVEDDERVATALNLRMKSAGYETVLASDAIQGISRAASFQPDLVVLDINLPAGNGIDLALRIRTILPVTTPIIFLTASKQPGLVERATSVGSPVNFIEKPYSAERLLAAARRGLGEA